MFNIIEKYGKQLASELLGMVIIKRVLEPEKVRLLLIKHNIITKRTKIVRPRFYTNYLYGIVDGRYQKTGEKEHRIYINNGRNQSIMSTKFRDSEIQKILEALQ